jgi:hypothetical protein
MNKYARLIPWLSGTLLLGAALLAPVPVEAAFIAGQVGTACIPLQADASKTGYGSYAGIFNTNTTASAKVFCPLTYDYTEHATIGNSVVSVIYNDRNSASGKNVSCSVIGSTGSVGYNSGAQVSSGAQSGTFSFMDVPFDGTALNVVCDLPPNANGGQSNIALYNLQPQD